MDGKSQNKKNPDILSHFQTVLLDSSLLIGQKLVENAKIPKFQLRHFESFSNSVTRQFTFNRTKIGGKCQDSKISTETF